MHIGRLPALGADHCLDLFAFLVQDISKHHFGAFPGKHGGFHSALASGTTANQRYFPCQPCHILSPA
jgi:hypothetical protein